MNTEDVKRYAVEVLRFWTDTKGLTAEEIGDGNINYVFRIRSEEDGRSLIVKQADSRIRTSGNPLDIGRNRIEAALLKFEGELAPGYVPVVYYYDEIMAATSMEDVSAFKNLRKELMAGRVYGHLAENLSSFVADTLLPTTDLVIDAVDKKKRVSFFTNPQLCRITEDLVLTEPYYDYKGRNILTPGNEDFVKKELYDDGPLHAEVGMLREAFMNHAQALLHGDLHTGSVFANETGIRVLDPEFGFYGPIGYDIGNVIANLFFALAYHTFAVTGGDAAGNAVGAGGSAENAGNAAGTGTAAAGETAGNAIEAGAAAAGETATAPGSDAAERLNDTIEAFCDLTAVKLRKKYDEIVSFPFYREPAFEDRYLEGILSDTYGYAGTEIIRRTVGDSKVAELNTVTDPTVKIPMERALIRLGKQLILRRGEIRCGAEAIKLFKDSIIT